jgi:hypothetical protein
MHRHVFTDSQTEFRRISKREAMQRFERGEAIAFCPHRLRPGFPFALHCTIRKDDSRHWSGVDKFDTRLNEFICYNCSHEAGYYAAFYRMIDRNKPAHAIGTI